MIDYTPFIGRCCIIRSDMAGVFWGKIEQIAPEGDACVASNVRRIYSWEGALSCSDLASTGCQVDRSQITACVPLASITGNVVEINVCAVEVNKIIETAPIWHP